MTDPWNRAEAYEAYVGRWSRRLAPEFIEWARVPPGASVLDVGCGTGAVAEALLTEREAKVTGVDLSPAHVDEARRRLAAEGARFEVGDARSLPFPDASFDAAVSALVLNFVPAPAAMVSEMRRVVKPEGALAACVWDYAGKMEMMRHFWDAAVALEPEAAQLDEATRFPGCNPASLSRLFVDAGLRDVDTRAIDLPTVFRDFDDLWTPFLGGQGPAPAYVASLDEKGREALREHFRARLLPKPDGSIELIARAWAVRGRVPASA